MNTKRHTLGAGLPFLALAFTLFLAACGGSSGNDMPGMQGQPPTGTVALLFTDKPTDEFSAIKLNVREAILIGGDSADGQQVLFEGNEPIDLLDLSNFSEPVVFGEVDAGIYTKLRLVIDSLELVPLDGGLSIFPKLPANGRIDMLDPSGIEVLPGQTMVAQIDMQANKAIHIVGAGNSGQYKFRPVVRATFSVGSELPDKLARLDGTVEEIYTDPAGGFELCDIETPDSCVDVATGMDTSVFDDMGLGTDFASLMVGDTVTVIGQYSLEGGIVLDALVLEIGGNAQQIQGEVVSMTMAEQFLVLSDENGDIVVELQPGTKYYDPDGPMGSDAIIVGASVEVEGVMPPKAVDTDPDLIRAALVFVEPPDEEQASGTIIEPLDIDPMDPATWTFGLTLDGGGDICVRVNEDADVLLVNTTDSEVTMGTVSDLALDQSVDLFGTMDGCFYASEVIVDVSPVP
jgi:Domain of unknown function (DUF4382)